MIYKNLVNRLRKAAGPAIDFPDTLYDEAADAIEELLKAYEKKLEDISGRLLVRPSGTEPLIRITMWGDDEDIINKLANELKDELKNNLT